MAGKEHECIGHIDCAAHLEVWHNKYMKRWELCLIQHDESTHQCEIKYCPFCGKELTA